MNRLFIYNENKNKTNGEKKGRNEMEKIYVIKCKSNLSGIHSVCHEDGNIKKFTDKEKAEEYAKKCRDRSMWYHYWVEEQ